MTGAGAVSALRLGTRGSPLALVQTELVQRALARRHAHVDVAVIRIATHGDIVVDRPLTALGERGVFVAEIETALREGRIDLAVHSAKDLPSVLPSDMQIAAFLPRADPRDVFISSVGDVRSIAGGSRVGTSSPRRACQLRAFRHDLRLVDIRGNVDTRLRKLAAGEFDAIVLAMAGLERLGLSHLQGGPAMTPFDCEEMLPAPGQGALAVEICRDRDDLAALLAPLNDHDTQITVTAERAFLAAVGGGCSAVAAAFATIDGHGIVVRGMVGAIDGRQLREVVSGAAGDGVALAESLAAALLSRGGAALLRAANSR